jgi:pimeloyl-ACP methyl ester carboxylesterase
VAEIARERPLVRTVSASTARGIRTADVLVGAEDAPLEAFLIEPVDGPARAGILFLHWLGEHQSDRTQFRAEARGFAPAGVVSVLPAGRFPWTVAPSGAVADTAAIETELGRLEVALAALTAALPAGTPIALVGHDFGAMHGIRLLARHPEIEVAVVIAASPRWPDWFLPFWPIAENRPDYVRHLTPLDPIEELRATKARVLFQFSKRDYFIAPMTAVELSRVRGEREPIEWYDVDHAMRSRRARAARETFLRRELSLD